MKWIWLLAIGCSASAPVSAPAPPTPACVSLPLAGPHEVVGRVTDRDGAPLAGVRVDEAVWSEYYGQWKRFPGASTTTAADGTYGLALPHSGALLVFERDGRQVVWGHVWTPRRIDVVLDGNAAPGVIAMFDARVSAEPCAAWQCPIDRLPDPGWWTRPQPCPDGGTLRFELAPDVAIRAGAGVHCELAGQRHGPTTRWVLVEHSWTEESGWFDRGERCGTWREAPTVEPPPPTP